MFLPGLGNPLPAAAEDATGPASSEGRRMVAGQDPLSAWAVETARLSKGCHVCGGPWLRGSWPKIKVRRDRFFVELSPNHALSNSEP